MHGLQYRGRRLTHLFFRKKEMYRIIFLIPGMEKKIRTVQYAVKVSIMGRILKTFILFYTEIIVKTVLCLEAWSHLQMKNFLKSISLSLCIRRRQCGIIGFLLHMNMTGDICCKALTARSRENLKNI